MLVVVGKKTSFKGKAAADGLKEYHQKLGNIEVQSLKITIEIQRSPKIKEKNGNLHTKPA